MAIFTVHFRGKLTEDGDVKVPKLTGSHVSLIGNDDTTATLFVGGMSNVDITRTRLANMIGAKTGDYYWPGWASESAGFTISPIGNGFMANVSIELDTANMRKR
jgi:hypothetical protein